MEVRFAVLCDYAIVDRDNKLSVLGIFDEIRPPSLPFNLPAIYMVVAFEGSAAEAGVDLRVEYLLWGEDGSQLFQRETTIRFSPPDQPGDRVRHNEIMGLHGLPLTAAGSYAFIVRVNNEERSHVALRVFPPNVGTHTND
ncbi:MAG: hypothetical protein Q7R32_07610 [Dehalococcoidia bacterium]|nr:hypothetical protein [Dehalococcoidia bacterium]